MSNSPPRTLAALLVVLVQMFAAVYCPVEYLKRAYLENIDAACFAQPLQQSHHQSHLGLPQIRHYLMRHKSNFVRHQTNRFT